MSIVLQRPYQFVAPHRGDLWPSLIQRLRIVDRYLAKKEGIVDYEIRGLEHWQRSLEKGDGILLAPNHCRYADPLVLGWPARKLNVHLHAMASWHLFNTGWFDSFGIQKMGGFSINREGTDRQSLDTAIGILATAQRPLILFPEGTTNRTNDVLKPLLDGVAFIARAAARKRAKSGQGQVVMHPVAMKYLCIGDVQDWADEQLCDLETRIGWVAKNGASILDRTIRVAEAMLALKEIQYLGSSQSGSLPCRRDSLIEQLLSQAEQPFQIDDSADVRTRVRAIRTEVVTKYFRELPSDDDARTLRRYATMADLAQELLSYPDCYLESDHVTDTRIVETIQRMQESFLGKANVDVPLKVVIQFDHPITIPSTKADRGTQDPVMAQLRQRLVAMVEELSREARPATEAGLN